MPLQTRTLWRTHRVDEGAACVGRQGSHPQLQVVIEAPLHRTQLQIVPLWNIHSSTFFLQHFSTFILNIHSQHSFSTFILNIHSQHSFSTVILNIHSQHSFSTFILNILQHYFFAADSSFSFYLGFFFELNVLHILYRFSSTFKFFHSTHELIYSFIAP